MSKVLLILLVFNAKAAIVTTFEPISTVAAVSGVVFSAIAGYDFVRCRISECCDDKWIKVNLTGLRHDFHNLLHGQHLVSDTVLRSIQGHFKNPNPAKALVLSLHGWTGCGKNFVSKMIANNLFDLGMKSSFVHLIVSSYHFPHVSSVEQYKDDLRQWVKGNVTRCSRSLFIFDEMDKMPGGMIDAIKPFIDHYPELDGLDYRKSVFIFLSNTGGDIITHRTLDHWKQGLIREDLKLLDMEQLLTLEAFNEKGGLWHSSLVEKNLISAYVPFLPMERKHIKLCIVDDFKQKGHNVSETDEIVNQVADMLTYYPSDTKLFVRSGCKRVSEKVDYILEGVS